MSPTLSYLDFRARFRDVAGDFFADTKQLAAQLVNEGHTDLGEEVQLAIEAGSTGSEILMRLRAVFERALAREGLAESTRQKVLFQLEAVNRSL